MSGIHIGTSGWSYDHWQGILYPEHTPVSKRLSYYIERYDTVEVNNTFYRWPRDETFEKWREQTPDNFLMTVKASRFLTHNKKLREPGEWLERIESGLQRLGPKKGLLLVQLPPRWKYNAERLDEFLQAAPRSFPIAMEFRDPSWHTEEIFAVLEKHQAAYCITSGANLPCILRTTAPFVYVRFHGPDAHYLYAGSYSDEELSQWAERIRDWRKQKREIWVYFNNDGHGYALRNADTLKSLLKI